MSLRKVEPDILERLNCYLRTGKSLPTTRDGKISVEGLVRVLQLPLSDVQNFYRKTNIRTLVNAMAVKQGIKPMGGK